MQANAPNVLNASPMDPCFSPMHKTSNGVKMVSTHHIVYYNPQNHPSPLPPNWHIMLLQPCEACETSNDGGVNERKKQNFDPKTHMLQQNLTMLQQSCLVMMGPLQLLKLPSKKQKKTSMLETFGDVIQENIKHVNNGCTSSPIVDLA
jgi:hypothetical protein